MRVTWGPDVSNTTESDPVNTRLPPERRAHTDITKVAGVALLATAVEVFSDIPVRRVTTSEMMGLHGTRRSDERRARLGYDSGSVEVRRVCHQPAK